MIKRVAFWLWENLCIWLVKEDESTTTPLCDFNRLSYELRLGDIILVEGRSRFSRVIKMITQSAWTHSALYMGRIKYPLLGLDDLGIYRKLPWGDESVIFNDDVAGFNPEQVPVISSETEK